MITQVTAAETVQSEGRLKLGQTSQQKYDLIALTRTVSMASFNRQPPPSPT